MNRLLEKIRKILHDRRVRRMLTRTISVFSAIIVFVTTYALILPAITVEKQAACGIEEHQHTEDCYEKVLICDLPESEGHQHTDGCYSVKSVLSCDVPEHVHGEDCYDENGDLICGAVEHVHDESCYQEVEELTCSIEESEGHRHDASCYEKVLTCGKEAHIHSVDCYEADENTASRAESQEDGEPAAADEMIDEIDEAGELSFEDDEDSVQNASAENYVPELAPLNMDAMLNEYTGVYYYQAQDGEEIPENSADITDWTLVKEDTELASTDLVKLYFAYMIPEGSLNETNPVARYRLPENVRLTDEQIEAINKNENGFAAGYEQFSEEYEEYLGAEAIEGIRRPDEQLEDDAEEFISAVVKVEETADGGQELVFTFLPYSIEKNQNTYDVDENIISAGQMITGWFACDFTLEQIDWVEEETQQPSDQEEAEISSEEDAAEGTEEGGAATAVEKTADIIFVPENREEDIEEISTTLRLVEQKEEEEADPSEDAEEAEEAADDAAPQETSEDAKDKENTEDTENTKAVEDSGDAPGSGLSTDETGQEYKDGTLTTEGDGYKITLDYTAEAQIPEGAELSVREITADTDRETYEQCLEQAGKQVAADDNSVVDQETTRFFDIEILVRETGEDGTEALRKIEPAAPVGVNIQLDPAPAAQDSRPEQSDPTVLHFAKEGVEQIDSTVNNSPAEERGDQENEQSTEVSFEAKSFSIYGVVYTVDFHWEVDGKAYDFSIPGGGFVSLEHLVEVLGIAGNDLALDTENSAEDAESEEVAASEDAVSLNKLPVSESAKQFVADVQSVELSSPDLVWVGKADDETTVGGLKEANELACDYSAELTEEQIAEIDAQTVKEGDWALISLQPFTSEEVLTVTMKGGEVFTIRLTDAVIPSSGLVEGNRYILYAANSSGQYFALRGDGYCYRVPNNDLDSLGDEYLWRYHYVSDGWAAGTCEWFSQNDAYQIELWGVDNTAVNNQYGSYIRLDPASNGGYYFLTNNGDYGTFGLWLYNNVYSYPQTWSFRPGDVSQHNRSEIFIYEKEPLHQYTVNVNDNNYGQVRLTDSTTAWVTSGQGSIDRNGNNTHFVEARANDGYWFDHWELDGQQVEETDGISDSRIETGALNIGNEDGHILTAVFVPETSFNVEASPSGSGSVNVNSSPRTRDGYNKELISAAAGNGWWFGHWEIDGEEVPESSYTISEDGLSSALPARSLNIGDGNTLTAVFIPQITYDVTAIPETAGASITGCTVQVGNSLQMMNVSDNEMTRWGYNVDDIKAYAGPGYVFKGWLLDDEPIMGGAEIENALDGSSSTIKAGTLQVSTDGLTHTVKAVFVQEYNFTVTTYPNGGGVVQDDTKEAKPTIYASMTKNGHNKYDITAIPSSGYRLHHWTINGQPLEEGEGAEKHYLYLEDNTIPAGVLDLTSSDNLCAVFVKAAYTITVDVDNKIRVQLDDLNGQSQYGIYDAGEWYKPKGSNNYVQVPNKGSVNISSVSTESNSDIEKRALRTIVATPNNGYKFAYWEVEDANGNPVHNAVVDWGEGCDVTSARIQPKVNSDTKLHAVFIEDTTRVFTVTVDDPSHGTVWGPDVSGKDVTNDAVGVTSYRAKTKRSSNNYVNDGRPQVRTTAQGYEFLGWNLYYSDGRLYKSYTSNDSQGNQLKKWQLDNGAIVFPADNMVLKAMFKERDPRPEFEDENMADLSDWADEIAGTNYLSDKRAEVFDYDNRIYKIGLSASSLKKAIDSSVVINFITDTSRSMYFPANLQEVKNIYNQTDYYGYNGGGTYGNQLNSWLSNKNRNNI